jgi:tetratricopeptide (TPR) repeat protein
LDEKASQQLWDEYFPIFRALLEQIQFVPSYPMYKHEHGETYRLQSSELTAQEKGTQTPARVWMENPQGESMDILPFFVVPGEVSLGKEDKEQILAYESYTGKTIKFFSPEGTEKQTSGKILEKLNLLLRDKQKEHTYTPEEFTKEVFQARVADENKLILDTLVAEKKVIPGVYVHREDMEIKLREWIGARANIFVIAAEAGSGKTNLLVEMQKQYTDRDFPTLLICAGRMDKTTLHAQLCYLFNIDERENLAQYPAIAGTQEAPTFVLIDGLNEAHDAEKLWTELFEISQLVEPGSLKFVVTSRANTAADINRYGVNEEQESFLYGDNKEREKQVSAYTHWLAALSMEEMKQAWECYVQKDKSKFKPQFDFDDLATFDRALYNQISNPLVLRLFLETYQGKNLPKKGKQHLDIWSDWLTSFSEEEQEFFTALANAIWEKGENELLLDDVLKDNTLHQSFTTDQLNAPYPRLRNLGWVSRYVKDLNACVGFTVEGALLHLLGKKLEKQEPGITTAEIKKLLQTGSPLQQAGVGAYMQQLALKGDLNTVCELIDAGEEFVGICVTPIVLHLRSIGVKETLDILLQNPTENDWKALLKVDATMEELTLHPLRKELATLCLPKNEFSSKAAIQLGLKGIRLIDKEEGESFVSKINLNKSDLVDDAEIFSSIGDLYSHFGEYDKALEFYLQCLDIRLKTLGNQHPSVATSYNNIGLAWDNKGDYDKALEFYQQCLEIQLKTLGNQHPAVANSYNNIGSAWASKGDYDKALEFYQQCSDIQLKTLGNQHPAVANSYNNIGLAWANKGAYDKALEFYQKSLNIYIKTVGHQHPLVATSYNNTGSACECKGEYDKALEYYQESLDITLKTLGNQHPDVAISYNNIGTAWNNKGEYDKALESYQQCLDIQIKTLGNQHPSVAASYSNIGSAWESKGEYDEALVFYQQCLSIELITLGNQHPAVAISYSNIGSAWESKGEYDKALEFYQQCLSIELKTLGNQHPSVAASYNYIASAWKSKGEYDKALEFYQQSLDIYIKTLGNQHPWVATSYNNIGSIWNNKGEYDKALEFFEQCLDIRLKTLGNKHPDAAASYNNIASAWDKKGEYDKALEFYQQCLDIQLKTLGNQHPSVATSYNNLGSAWYNKGEHDKALEFFEQCLDIRLKTLGNQHPSVATSYNNIGLAWDNKGEYDKALEFYQQCLEIQLKTLGNQHPAVAISYSKIGVAWLNKGENGKAYMNIGIYLEALSENETALEYYLQSAEIRKDDPDLGLESESTQEAIAAAKRLAIELGKETELPEWMKNNNQ